MLIVAVIHASDRRRHPQARNGLSSLQRLMQVSCVMMPARYLKVRLSISRRHSIIAAWTVQAHDPFPCQRIDKARISSRCHPYDRTATAGPGLRLKDYRSLVTIFNHARGMSSNTVVRAHPHGFVDHFHPWSLCGSFGTLHGVNLEVLTCRLTSFANPLISDYHFSTPEHAGQGRLAWQNPTPFDR